jgi:hypothetical protein
MRKVAMLVCLCFMVAALVAPALLAAGKTHDMKGTVVSVDVAGKMLTVKDEKGESKTAPVLGDAVKMLGSLKAGDKVTLTCQDNEKGEHTGITAIKISK